jgi:hypothetical protein
MCIADQKNKLTQHSQDKKSSDRTKNGKVGPDCRGHRAFCGTTGIPFDASHKVEQKCTLGLRSVRVTVVVYVFNLEGNNFWWFSRRRKCTGVHGGVRPNKNEPPPFMGAPHCTEGPNKKTPGSSWKAVCLCLCPNACVYASIWVMVCLHACHLVVRILCV